MYCVCVQASYCGGSTHFPIFCTPLLANAAACLEHKSHSQSHWFSRVKPRGTSASPCFRRNSAPMAVNWNHLATNNTLIGLGLGQLLSLLITSTGFSSSELAKKGINAPTSQSFSNYVLLAVVYGGIMIFRRRPLKAKWYYYALLGLVDVEANFLVVKAYQYTSITSVMLLDCWTIPCVLFLTWFFLKTDYRFKKFVGVGICVVGLVMVIFSDVHSADRLSGTDPVRGDLLVIAGATLYAVCNVSEEFFVKSVDRVELMAFLGLFGAIVSACQIGLLERHELESIHWSAGAAIPFVGFSLAMFLFYSGVPILLKISGSTMLNLSLLTSDMWSVLIRIFSYNEEVDWLYYLAFAAVAIGIIVYSSSDDNAAEITDMEKNLDKESCLCHYDAKETSGDSDKNPDVGSSSASEKGGLSSKHIKENYEDQEEHLTQRFLQD